MTRPLVTRRQQTPSASGILHPPFLGISERLLDGSIVETIDVDVVEDGGVVNLQLQEDGGGDLTCRFAGQSYELDCTPVLELTLTVGTDVAPQINYVYITEAAGVLTLTKSTTGWPATAYCPIATVLVQSAASLATDGAYKVHVWTDHFYRAAENGMLAHINKKLRALQATWKSGVSASNLVVADPDAYISTTAGVVFQLHEHVMPAIDMETPAPVFLVNDPTTAYKRITTFDDITQDASTGGINNKYMNLVLWGVTSENEADCKLFINLPTATYTVEATAMSDDAQTAVYSFPDAFVGTAFLIARYTVKAKDAGEWSQSQKVDLRGLLPSSAAGGGLDTTHTILDGSIHTDSVTQAVVRGALQYGNATPAWDLLTVGAAGTFLGSDGTDAAWNATVVTADANLTDDALVRGKGGALGAQTSLAILNDAAELSGLTQVDIGWLQLRGAQARIDTTFANMDLWLVPNGDGEVAVIVVGTAKANRDVLRLDNTVTDADMDGTETSLLFRQTPHGGVITHSGRITVGTETDWTAVATTRDSYMAFHTTKDGAATEKVHITSDGRVGIGTDDPGNAVFGNAFLIVQRPIGAAGGVDILAKSRSNVAAARPRLILRRARGVIADAVVQNGDTLAEIEFQGYDGLGWNAPAEIQVKVDAVPNGGVPGAMIFKAGVNAGTERLRIQSDGNILVDADTSVFVRDSALGFNSSADGQLDLFADTEVEITAPTIELAASTHVLVSTLVGIDYGTGADADMDLMTVLVTGTPRLWWDESEDAFVMTHRLDLSAAGVQTQYAVDDVADPPTDAELDTAFGDPTVIGPGFVGILDDGGAGLYCYICWTTGTAGEWFYVAGTKAV